MSDTNTVIPSDGNAAYAAYAAEVQDELRRILSSERFFRAEGLKVFLGFIVERTLQGHATN